MERSWFIGVLVTMVFVLRPRYRFAPSAYWYRTVAQIQHH